MRFKVLSCLAVSLCACELSPLDEEAAARSREALGAPYRLKDINTTTNPTSSSVPRAFTAVPGTTNTIFYASTAAEGEELWGTDGTLGGTELLRDIWAGANGCNCGTPVPFAGRLYFNARETGGYRGLWRTDGTIDGTERVTGTLVQQGPVVMGDRLIYREPSGLYVTDGGVQGSTLVPNTSCSNTALVGAPTFALFDCYEGAYTLWVTDGSSSGAYRLLDAGVNLSASATLGAQVLFVSGQQLWVTDGTPAGTVALADFPGGTVASLVKADPYVYFSVTVAGVSTLWRTDGTSPGTVALSSPYAGWAAPLGTGLAYFADGTHLWLTDGFDAGLVTTTPSVVSTLNFTSAGDTAWFKVGNAPWLTDGTAAGTRRVTTQALSQLQPFGLGADGRMYFGAGTSTTGVQPWVSDGTDAGTMLLRHLTGDQSASTPANFFSLGNVATFTTSTPDALWRTDGTPSGTQQVSTTLPLQYASAGPYYGAAQGKLYFRNSTSTAGIVLFRTDGFSVESLDVVPGATTAMSMPWWHADDLGFFATVSDGMTQRLVGFAFASGGPSLSVTWPSASASDAPQNFARVGETLFFSAVAPDAGAQVFRTDGRSVVQVTNVGTTSAPLSGGIPQRPNMIGWHGRLYFTSYPTAAHGLMRLECDGGVTAVGGYHTLGPPVATDDALYFAGQNYLTYVIGLYKYDGTSMSLVKSFGDGGAAFIPDQYAMDTWGNQVLLRVRDDANQWVLYVSDGTSQGTRRATDFKLELPGSTTLAPRVFAAPGGALYLSASTPDAGTELWEYPADGGAPSTVEFLPGRRSGTPQNFALLGDTLLFSADDGTGAEPWAVAIERSPVVEPQFTTCAYDWPDAGPYDAGSPPVPDAGMSGAGGGSGATGGGSGATGGGVGTTGGGVGTTGGGVGATGGGSGATGGGVGTTGGGVGATGGGVGTTGGGVGATGGGVGVTGGGVGVTGGGDGTLGGGDGTTGGGLGTTGGGAASGGGAGATGGGAPSGGGSATGGGGGAETPTGCGCTQGGALEFVLGAVLLALRRQKAGSVRR